MLVMISLQSSHVLCKPRPISHLEMLLQMRTIRDMDTGGAPHLLSIAMILHAKPGSSRPVHPATKFLSAGLT